MADGSGLEREVHMWVRQAVRDGVLGLVESNTRVYSPHRLFSRDRQAEIEFDVVIEVFRTRAPEPLMYWIWECKDYTHNVPVDDIEEFHSKLEQVGRDRTKGFLVSTAGFQKSVLMLAESYGIALYRVVRPTKTQSTTNLGALIGDFPGLSTVHAVRESPEINSLPDPTPNNEAILTGADCLQECFVFQTAQGQIGACVSWNDLLESTVSERES